MHKVAACALFAVLACKGAPRTMPPAPPLPADPDAFPRGFLFGTAIAGFQVEMGCPTVPAAACEDHNSDWYVWITNPALRNDPSTHLSSTLPANGPGFFELYAQDLELAAGPLHGNALRTSIEWSRLFPTSTVGVSDLRSVASSSALAYYHALFAAMSARGLAPLVTLHHYTLPTWMHDAVGCHRDLSRCSPRGWLEPGIATEMARYAAFAAQEFPEVKLWATLNEPFTAVVLAGFLMPSATRTNPPGVTLRWVEARQAYAAMIAAHARVYDAIKQVRPEASVGIVYNLQAVSPRNPDNSDDVRAAAHLDYLMNRAFINAITTGHFDARLDGTWTYRDDFAGRLDYLGVNYYDRTVVQGTGSSLLPNETPLFDFDPLTLGIVPDATGLGEALASARAWQVPLYVTETGLPDPDDTGAAAQWIRDTLRATRAAMDRGADVRGYFYWTLMDNYEWNHGMDLKFGLYAVDPQDPAKKRVPRGRAIAALATAAASGKVP